MMGLELQRGEKIGILPVLQSVNVALLRTAGRENAEPDDPARRP
ncbi:hypothetical protein [Dickeya solani]|uniref:Uncharacterized protein n=1 Tax=Dickeya solani TaxID=1089444 RepID=A0ABU4EEQ4_9GAMM|nr:hypothetical protein [Dickeya solani]MCZ0822499.1 hypothetical protein [Dickeya solani]MDV6994083.1 hypothetical protein [Dickeya solani]MDV7004319.1 hypothetical protein [Dickeya solani]MDV7038392.1 hypothetical protein [Dickeya solani]MDV7042030.1 hypothetical protein [Dickeya solani]